MSKRTKQQSLSQQRKQAIREGQREKEKFYAWLGQILSTGMSQEDFEKAKLLHKQGVSVAAMQNTLEKPVTRKT